MLDYDEPVVEVSHHDDHYTSRGARSHKTAPSEVSDFMCAFPVITPTADEESTIFVVLGEEVNKSTVSIQLTLEGGQ